MKDRELQFDRKNHVLYSKPCKKEIRAKIALHYPATEREATWEKYAELYNSDKPITKETLLPILGKELILYRPLLEIYNPEGKLVGTVQN